MLEHIGPLSYSISVIVLQHVATSFWANGIGWVCWLVTAVWVAMRTAANARRQFAVRLGVLYRPRLCSDVWSGQVRRIAGRVRLIVSLG